MRFAKLAGYDGPFLAEVAQTVIDLMGRAYPELVQRRDFILEAVAQEEERFHQVLNVGLNILDQVIADVTGRGQKVIPGDEVFRLYDTYGFPHALTRDVAREHGLEIDEAGFNAAMEAQRERSRKGTLFAPAEIERIYRSLDLPATDFVGYQRLETQTRILAIVKDGQPVERVERGDDVEVVLAETSFYAEAGGQVGDTGMLAAPRGRVQVEDTQRPLPTLIAHRGRVVSGEIRVQDNVTARVDAVRRYDIMRNHTATHLLHRALREVLGDHAAQSGSLVAPDHLRFDFTHLTAVTPAELVEIERRVNEKIRADLPVRWEITSYSDALKGGAVALFGEKYGDQVRVVCIQADVPTGVQLLSEQRCYSKELCGGTHLQRTGQIGAFYIVSESSIGAGLRRIEALTGRGAEYMTRERLTTLAQVAEHLQVAPEAASGRVTALLDELEAQRKEIARLRRQIALAGLSALVERVQTVSGVKVLAAQVEATSVEMLREMSDWLRDKLGSGVIVLGAVVNDKPAIIAAVTPDLVSKGFDAGKLARQVAQVVGGSGGGRPTLAQAGGKDASKLGDALARVPEWVVKQ